MLYTGRKPRKSGGFKEFEIFNMRDNRMEYEANLFAAQISLSDEDFLELAERFGGYETDKAWAEMLLSTNTPEECYMLQK